VTPRLRLWDSCKLSHQLFQAHILNSNLECLSSSSKPVLSTCSSCLDLTPVLWAPQNWLYWLQIIFMFSETPTWIDVDILIGNNPAGPCLTQSEESGCLRPSNKPVRLLWPRFLPGLAPHCIHCFALLIRHSKFHEGCKHEEVIEGEILAALMYPLIAMIDILYRLIRCKMDPSINAALLDIYQHRGSGSS